MKKFELLSPVGYMECLKAAVIAGADAVYLSGKLFGARSFAGNFTNEELIDAIKYAHLNGVKVYVAANTIVYEHEVERFLEFIRFIHKNNVDAVIIQDLGMFDLLRKKFPNLVLHASTQMHIHNYEGALLAKKLGFNRIVMARETPFYIIEKIKKELDIEVEVFIHGALCISYSGQCLASALIGNRSGNRGTCAQVCRKKYNLYDEDNNKLNTDNYLLSTKDLCTLENIDKLINIGVDSLKIEGRMKRPSYVYLVTSIYRKVIDNYYKNNKLEIDKKDILELKKIFNREFTKGFMFGEDNNNFTYEVRPNHKGINIGTVISKKKDILKIKLNDSICINDGLRILDEKEDKGIVINNMYDNNTLVKEANAGDVITIKYDGFVDVGSDVLLTTSSKQISKIEEILKNTKKNILIDINVSAKCNDYLKLEITDGKNTVNIKSDNVIEKAINNPTSKDILIKQISKTGDTIYKVNNINVNMDDNIFINIKEINELRRKALEELNNKRLYEIPFVENDYYFTLPDFNKKEEKNILLSYNKNINLNLYDNVYTENINDIKNNEILKIPRVNNEYINYDKKVLISEFGSLLKYKNKDTDYTFNVVNSYAVCFLHEQGVDKITLSVELTLKQIENIIEAYKKRYNKNPNLEVIYGTVDAMICKFDLNKKYNVNKSYLKDEFNYKYELISKYNYMVIKNFKDIKLETNEEEYYKLGINSIRFNS